MRIDKFLSHAGFGTRKEVKKLIRSGMVSVNGVVIKNDDAKIDEISDEIMIGDEVVNYQKDVYLMMNKPAGYISATEDANEPTVLDLFTKYEGKDIFPVGRLDKDTEGFLLLSNDGALRIQFGEKSWEHITQKFALDNHIKQLKRYIEEI